MRVQTRRYIIVCRDAKLVRARGGYTHGPGVYAVTSVPGIRPALGMHAHARLYTTAARPITYAVVTVARTIITARRRSVRRTNDGVRPAVGERTGANRSVGRNYVRDPAVIVCPTPFRCFFFPFVPRQTVFFPRGRVARPYLAAAAWRRAVITNRSTHNIITRAAVRATG